MNKVIIIGAGPAGLTAAYRLSNYLGSYAISLYEAHSTTIQGDLIWMHMDSGCKFMEICQSITGIQLSRQFYIGF